MELDAHSPVTSIVNPIAIVVVRLALHVVEQLARRVAARVREVEVDPQLLRRVLAAHADDVELDPDARLPFLGYRRHLSKVWDDRADIAKTQPEYTA